MIKQAATKMKAMNQSKWFWFVGLYALSMSGYGAVQYGGRWLIHTIQ